MTEKKNPLQTYSITAQLLLTYFPISFQDRSIKHPHILSYIHAHPTRIPVYIFHVSADEEPRVQPLVRALSPRMEST